MNISTRAGMICTFTILGLAGLGLSEPAVRVEKEAASETGTKPDAIVQDQAVDTVGDIEPSDVNKLERRKNAKKFSMGGFGPAWFGGVTDEARLSYNVYMGRAWEVNSRAAIKSNIELTSDFEDNHMVDISLGTNFYALPSDYSPYVGAALGLGGIRSHSDHAFGFSAKGSLGALLFRTSTAQLNLEGGAKILLSELVDEFPMVYMATLGVLF